VPSLSEEEEERQIINKRRLGALAGIAIPGSNPWAIQWTFSLTHSQTQQSVLLISKTPKPVCLNSNLNQQE
jgi:hypothetical protein